MVMYKNREIKKLIGCRVYQTYQKLFNTTCAYIAVPFPNRRVSTAPIFGPTKRFI